MYTQFQLFHFFVFHVCKFCNHFVLIWHFTNMSFSFCISYRHNAAICYSENLFFVIFTVALAQILLVLAQTSLALAQILLVLAQTLVALVQTLLALAQP